MNQFKILIKTVMAYFVYGLGITSLLGGLVSIYVGFVADPPSEEMLAEECRANVAAGHYDDFATCMNDALLAASSTEGVAGLMAAFSVFMAFVFYVIGRLILGKKKPNQA